MSPADHIAQSQPAAAAALQVLKGLPQECGEPVFRAPWEAQAFSMAIELHRRGIFTWSEWADRLSAQIVRAQSAGDPDTGETYYNHWLSTLEGVMAEKGVIPSATLRLYQHAWAHAAERTPHGSQIELSADDFEHAKAATTRHDHNAEMKSP